jgi:hypothetical protein
MRVTNDAKACGSPVLTARKEACMLATLLHQKIFHLSPFTFHFSRFTSCSKSTSQLVNESTIFHLSPPIDDCRFTIHAIAATRVSRRPRNFGAQIEPRRFRRVYFTFHLSPASPAVRDRSDEASMHPCHPELSEGHLSLFTCCSKSTGHQ